MEIISKRERVECSRTSLEFENNDGIGGYSFDCDPDGNLLPLTNPAAVENYEYCLANPDKVTALGVRTFRWHYNQPAIGKCCCGQEVHLEHFTNTCDCGRDYNSSGCLLGPREQWGEETGESVADILMIP